MQVIAGETAPLSVPYTSVFLWAGSIVNVLKI